MYNFDQITERKGTHCVKWDVADKAFRGTDLLPMWIADMDFPAAPGIVDSMQKRLEQGVFGYGTLSADYYQAVISWMKRRHKYEVEKDWICYTPGIVSALNFAVEALTEPGDELLIPTPVYGPFYHAVEDQGRTAVRVPLQCQDGRYSFDFDALENAVTSRTKALMLCSPHNPVGRVWDKDELESLSDFIIRHNLYVIDDEIHHDLVYKKEHTVLCRISKEIEQRTILCTAPSKSFNIAGIQASNIIIANEELRQKFRQVVHKHHAFSANSFVEAAVIGAYDDSEDWLNQLLEYLQGNVEYFVEFIQKNLPQIKVSEPEGTYLVWVDCSGLNMTQDELNRFFVEQCHLALNAGDSFGKDGSQYMRFNLACPRKLVEQALTQLQQGIGALGK